MSNRDFNDFRSGQTLKDDDVDNIFGAKGNGHGGAEPRFKLIPFAELKSTTAPSYLVKGLIPRIGLIVVWGPPKCGKSFWTFDLVMHIALGWDYRGRRTRSGPVVYCAFEGAAGFNDRAEAFRREHHVQEAPFYLVPALVNLIADHAQLVADIRAQCAAPVVVVLDTLNRSLVGSESNDQDMANYVKAADTIREAFGCAVIIVHHCGVDGSRPRGHTSLTGAADAQLAVKRDEQQNIVVTVEFMKDGPEGAKIGSRLERVPLGVDDDGDEISSCIVNPAEPGEIGRKVSGAAAIALKLLHEAMAAGGALPPASNYIPPGKRTVSIDLWQRYCEAGMISDSDKTESKQKAFKRVCQTLQDRSFIGIWNGQVWIATSTQNRPDKSSAT
jgi:hypothetical protein